MAISQSVPSKMGNKIPPPDERVVYLALKNIFKGQNAQVRKIKAVTKLLKQHKTQENVANLLREYNFDIVCNLATNLLNAEIFDSTLKAKVRFPELFEPSPTQSAEEEASEAEAARCEADAIRNARQIGGESLQHSTKLQRVDEKSDSEAEVADSATDKVEISKHAPASLDASASIERMMSIFPVYLPLGAQHRLFVHIQDILEHVCYDYGSRKLPDTLKSHSWDCPEAVELNIWVAELSKKRAMFNKTPDIGVPLEELFQSIANIRHTAVHRIRVHAKGIERYLDDAERFMTLLGDDTYIGRFSKLRRDTRNTLEELGRNKHLLRAKLDVTRQQISEEREKLNLSERNAIAEMAREDEEYQLLAANCVESAIAPSEASFSTAVDGTHDDGTAFDDAASTDECVDHNKLVENGWEVDHV